MARLSTAGAVRLAKSTAFDNQAFQIGRHVIGLQFHLETTRVSAQTLLANCSSELMSAPYIQTESQMRGVPDSAYAEINDLMSKILSYLTGTHN